MQYTAYMLFQDVEHITKIVGNNGLHNMCIGAPAALNILSLPWKN